MPHEINESQLMKNYRPNYPRENGKHNILVTFREVANFLLFKNAQG
ncbi:hypothetical protein HMPREF0880_01646 [Yokenella regensburgei ATCC 43003]|jgi:hypothetical protein|nr:hypothetical protein HMPREF0880_01646 [Yokenella regensburgei ATCC 43003]